MCSNHLCHLCCISTGLARKLANDNNLAFVETPALQPAEVQLDDARKQQLEAEAAAAAAAPLPDEDDDII